MFHYAHPDEAAGEDVWAEVDTVLLGWELVEAFHLWVAYEKGILPRAGGYLDQPRAFRRLVETLNYRYARMLKLTPEEVADRRMQYRPDLDPRTLAGDEPAVTSFDMFRRG